MTTRAVVGMALCAVAALLAGCAHVTRVDNQVKTYAQWASGADPKTIVSYRFERLPSQTGGPEATGHSALEGMVERALARSGWQQAVDGASTPWQVQVTSRTDKLPRAPWEEHADGRWMRGGLWASQGAQAGFSGMWLMEMPYYLRTLSVVVRDTRSSRVVYESTAAHDGRWNDSPALWQAMVDATLNGFPHPPAAVRQVNIDIPR